MIYYQHKYAALVDIHEFKNIFSNDFAARNVISQPGLIIKIIYFHSALNVAYEADSIRKIVDCVSKKRHTPLPVEKKNEQTNDGIKD